MTTTRHNLFASARRRRPLRLGVRGLLAAPLALSLTAGGEAMAAGAFSEGHDGCGVEIFVDDQPAPRCDSLFGDDDAREDNESWRHSRIMAVESGSRTLDVVHTDAKLRRPEVRALSGMVVREIFQAEVFEGRCADHEGGALASVDAGDLPDEDEDAVPDADVDAGVGASLDADAGFPDDAEADAGPAARGGGVLEHVARVELSERWAEVCGEESVVLRVDDALGSRGRVLHIDQRGMLTHLGGRLVWLSRFGTEAPVFRTTWRSSFSVIPDAVSKPASKARPKAKKRPKRRSRRR